MPTYDRILSIQQKTSAGFLPNGKDMFGNSPGLIEAIKNAGTSNLEEQLLLGCNHVDFYWEEVHDFYGKLFRTQTEYRGREQASDFYYTVNTKAEGFIAIDGSFFVNGETMFVPKENGEDCPSDKYNSYLADDKSLSLRNTDTGLYTYTIEGVDTILIASDRDDLFQYVEQTSLWYRPSGVTTSAGDKLIALVVTTPQYDLETGKKMQITEVENCWSDDLNGYPTRTEAETKWQIL